MATPFSIAVAVGRTRNSNCESLLAERGGKMEILEEGKFKMEGLGKVAKRYVLRIVHKDRVAA